MKRILSRPTAINVLIIVATTLCGQPVFAQTTDELNFDFTGNTTTTSCSGDRTYANTSGDETVAGGIDLGAGATINSVSVTAEVGKSGGFGSGTVTLLLNGNSVGNITGINSTCVEHTFNNVDLSFLNATGDNTISFTSSGSGTRRVYSATLILNYTPCAPPPAPAVPDNSIDYCLEEPTQALTATGSNLLWYTAPDGGNGLANAPVPSTDETGTVVYYVSQTVGCESDRTEVAVTVNANPKATVVGFTNVNCNGGSDGTITIKGEDGKEPYSYSVDNGLNWIESDDNPYIVTGLVANQAYKIRVEDSNGCESTSAQ